MPRRIKTKELNFSAIEKKWQKRWEEKKIFEVKEGKGKKQKSDEQKSDEGEDIPF